MPGKCCEADLGGGHHGANARGGRGDWPGCGGDGLAAWAARSGRPPAGRPVPGGLRFAFYGRVSTEDWQDPVTSRARQLQQAVMLTAGYGAIAAEFFDTGESRALPWTRRPQAAALVLPDGAGALPSG